LKAALVVSAVAGVTWMHWQHIKDFVVSQPWWVTLLVIAATIIATTREISGFCGGLSLLLKFGATLIRKIGTWRIWAKLASKRNSKCGLMIRGSSSYVNDAE
jgi:hypothetical protein